MHETEIERACLTFLFVLYCKDFPKCFMKTDHLQFDGVMITVIFPVQVPPLSLPCGHRYKVTVYSLSLLLFSESPVSDSVHLTNVHICIFGPFCVITYLWASLGMNDILTTDSVVPRNQRCSLLLPAAGGSPVLSDQVEVTAN